LGLNERRAAPSHRIHDYIPRMAPVLDHPGDKGRRALGRKRMQSVCDIVRAMGEKVEVGLARIINPYAGPVVRPDNRRSINQISAPLQHVAGPSDRATCHQCSAVPVLRHRYSVAREIRSVLQMSAIEWLLS
jgi:hypothetical protein